MRSWPCAHGAPGACPYEAADDGADGEHRAHEKDPLGLGVLRYHGCHVRLAVVGQELLTVCLAEEQVGHHAVHAERNPVDDVASYQALRIVIRAGLPHDRLADEGAHDGHGQAVETAHEGVDQAEHHGGRREHSLDRKSVV